MKKHFTVRTSILAIVASAFVAPALASAQTADKAEAADGNDIIVTAQRREERLADVPISVSAFSAQALERTGVLNSRDLVLVTPGLRFDAVGNTVQPTIRGITTTLAGGQEPNVATYLDGVIQTNPFSAIYELPDVQQIEVLKGPQGTLFGRNSTGGAILITTIPPDLHEATGKITVGYSSFDTVKGFGYVSVPLVADRVAIGLSGHYEDMSKGYVHDLTRNGKVTGGTLKSELIRAKLRFVPWEGADFTLQGFYSRRDDHAIVRDSNWKGNNARALGGLYTGPLANGPYEVATDIDPSALTKAKSISLRGTIEAGPGTLTTTTGYTRSSAAQLTDTDNTPQSISFLRSGAHFKTFSQELVYTTEELGRVHGVVGLNYFHNSVDAYNIAFAGTFATGVPVFTDYNLVKTEAFAAFGELTFDVTDNLSLTGGLRYSWEKKTPFKTTTSPPSLVRPATLAPLAPPKSWDSIDPRISLLYKVTDDTNLYFTFTKGFKSGEFNPAGAIRQVTSVAPEKVSAFEAGVKSTLGARFSLNLAAFYYDYKDLQVQSFQTINGALAGIVSNAASAKIKGLELGGDWRVTKEFRVSVGGSYLDTEYSRFPTASFTTPRREILTNTCPVPPSTSATAAICTVLGDVSGNRMLRAPKWSGNISATYTLDTSAGKFDASATLFASTKVYFDPSNRVFQPGYAQLNLNLTYSPPNSGFQARIYARNVTDHAVIISLVNTTSYDKVTYTPPRSFGAELSYKF